MYYYHDSLDGGELSNKREDAVAIQQWTHLPTASASIAVLRLHPLCTPKTSSLKVEYREHV